LRRALVLAAALAACGHSAEKSDWERQHEGRLSPPEELVALPAYPARARLIEFAVAAASEFRFFIDPASLSVGDGVVRYVLVASSPNGVDNVAYEGMRCRTGEVRTYALGRNGAWVAAPGAWRTIEPGSVQRWHNALYREYFCPLREPVGSARDAIEALRRGGSPGMPRGS
jgi:hypothetical protein